MKTRMMLLSLSMFVLLFPPGGFCQAPAGGIKTGEMPSAAEPSVAADSRETPVELKERQEKKADEIKPSATLEEKGDAEKSSSEASSAAEQGQQPSNPAADAVKKKPDSAPPLDRRWIMKMEKQPIPTVNQPKFNWISNDQQRSCEAISVRLKENYLKARDYSTQGDACKTAAYAKQFLDVKAQCQRDCPQGFLEGIGYSETIVRNIGTLQELGTRKCMGQQPARKGIK